MRALSIGTAALVFGSVPAATAVAQTSSPAPICTPSRFVDDPDLAASREALLTPDGGARMAEAGKALFPKLPAVMQEMQERKVNDWPFLCRYRADNTRLIQTGKRPHVVFIGDSITEFWSDGDPALFGKDTINRGISAQISGQILLRFYQDVVALKPDIVHLNAGTNDIGGNGGPAIGDDDIVNNLAAMVDIAQANHIRVILSSILPSTASAQYKTAGQAGRIFNLNNRLRALAAGRRVVFANYHSVLADTQGHLRAVYSNDGVHPSRRGYAAMRPIVEAALARAAR